MLLEILAAPQRHGLSGLFRETLQEMAERLRFLDERVGAYDDRIERVFKQDERCKRLAKIEGVGPLVATAVVAAVGNASEFKSGRELSAWLGLVPRQYSSGNRSQLLGISKRGDRYLRTILIHGARAALRRAITKAISAADGRCGSSSPEATTRRRLRSPTRTRASSGRCSLAARTIGRRQSPSLQQGSVESV